MRPDHKSSLYVTKAICRTLMLTLFATISITCSEARSQSAPKFELPDSILIGSPLAIRLSGLEPNSIVAIRAERIAGWSPLRKYSASIQVEADSEGMVDLSKQAPLETSESNYSGIEPLGLLWGMTPDSDESTERPPKDIVTFTVTEVNQDLPTPLAEHELEILSKSADVEETTFGADEEFEGAFLMMKPSASPLPVIITLGGSEGGDSSARRTAPALASQGFAVVGLPYYSPAYGSRGQQFKTLPSSFQEIPLDRIEAVLKTIDANPKLDGSRVGLHGVSKGGEFVLAIASRLDRFKAVAAIVPSDVIWEGWGSDRKTSGFTFKGEPLPFVPYTGMQETIAKLTKGEEADIRTPHDAGRAAFPDKAATARIRVEDIKAELMIIGGDSDKTWDSGGMCRNIAEVRKSEGLATETWISEEAGHYLSGHAYSPMAFAPADASFRTKVYPAMIEFFAKNLKLKNR